MPLGGTRTLLGVGIDVCPRSVIRIVAGTPVVRAIAETNDAILLPTVTFMLLHMTSLIDASRVHCPIADEAQQPVRTATTPAVEPRTRYGR